ncbi:uncharacterized protein LOC120456031 isoform X2 [Drosophila santomea]|uniref:uncharacterized protein LOC120456031 isoform X2 n=1 Tax=Drosophila santomea TaxID=129105 RepID=UPI001954C84A|nr:uncharacterized protein LOC120456031 isoform X2 [Drosophila santomea]
MAGPSGTWLEFPVPRSGCSKGGSVAVFGNLLPLVGTGVAVGVATCGIAAQIFRAPSSSNKMRSRFGNLGNLRFYSGGFQHHKYWAVDLMPQGSKSESCWLISRIEQQDVAAKKPV